MGKGARLEQMDKGKVISRGKRRIHGKIRQRSEGRGKEGERNVCAKMQNKECRNEIMDRKKNIGKEKVFIDPDWTMKQREIGEVRELAKEKKEEGNDVMVWHNGFKVGRGEWIWSEKEGRMKNKEQDERFRRK